MAIAEMVKRKPQGFLTNISLVSNTYDDVVEKNLKRGRFPKTKTGIIKIIGMCFEVCSIVTCIIVSQDFTGKEKNLGTAYTFWICESIGFVGQLMLFLLFSFGVTVKDPGRWISADVGFNFIFSLVTIVCAILSLVTYVHFTEAVFKLVEVFALCGAGFKLLSCAAILLMYRYVEDEDENIKQS